MTDEETPAQRRTRLAKERRIRQKQEKANVLQLFGPHETKPEDPDGIRPVAPEPRDGTYKYVSRKGKPRKTPPHDSVKVSARWTEVIRAVNRGDYTWKEFAKTLTPEELVRGQLMSKSGEFRGRPTTMVPNEFHAECVRELLRRGDQIWKGAYLEAIRVFTDIAGDPDVKAADRLKAAQYVVERIAGKVPERIEVAEAAPWQTIIDGIVAEAEDINISRATRILSGEKVNDDGGGEQRDPDDPDGIGGLSPSHTDGGHEGS